MSLRAKKPTTTIVIFFVAVIVIFVAIIIVLVAIIIVFVAVIIVDDIHYRLQVLVKAQPFVIAVRPTMIQVIAD